MGAFKAYDIRGIYNKVFDKETVYKIGYFLPKLLKSSVVLVGRDVRTSSDEIFASLCEGITDSGSDVYDIGLATTPMVYFSTCILVLTLRCKLLPATTPPNTMGLRSAEPKQCL